MAFTTNFVCSSFKQDLLAGRHNFSTSGGNTFKMSLHTNSATGMDASLTAYTTSGEVSSSGTAYTTTGNTLDKPASMPSLTTTVAWMDFDDEVWAASTFTARGAVIYNDSLTTPVADAACVVLDFGADKTSSAGDFTVVFPAANSTSAIIRIA
jgi:hypothetical protein